MTTDIESWDAVEITDANAAALGYADPDDRGLAVQQDGEWIEWAVDVDHAAEIISQRTGHTVRLVRSPIANYGLRWEARA